MINKDAWDILTEDEKAAISLSLGHAKSTWESGEIMKKAHFKYLEIQKRSRKFLEMFTNHFEIYSGLFPENLYLSFSFKEYISLTILDRYNISEAVSKMEDTAYSVASKRSKLILHEIRRLQKDDSREALDMYALIMDFDRWNNFRILPLEIQEPSAFKRRNKARNLKHLKKIISIPQFSILHIVSKYTYKGKYPKLFVSLVSPHLEEKHTVIQIKDHQPIIDQINSIGLFIFETYREADEFGELISDFFFSGKKTCKSGQKFWPVFREKFETVYNFNELSNIHKSRKYLDHAIFEKNAKSKGEPRQADKYFYQ